LIRQTCEEKVSVRQEEQPHDQQTEQHDLVDLMLESNEAMHVSQRLSIEEIVDHIFTFIFLGYENMVSTILWIFYELCRHPDIQRQCSEEVDRIMTVQGMHTSVVLFDDIPRFKHLIEVLKETLRLHPPIPAITGNCQAPCRKILLEKRHKNSYFIISFAQTSQFLVSPR
jgi:cytochrome P450